MKKTLLLAVACLLFSFTGYAQSALWQSAREADIAVTAKAARESFPQKYQLYKLDIAALKSALSLAPLRGNGQTSDVIIELPDGDGGIQHFRVLKAPVIAPGLEAKFPGIQSYIGQGIEKRSSIVRFSTTLFGLHAMTLTAGNGTHYIDPYTKDGQYYIVYKKSSLQTAKTFKCLTENTGHDTQKSGKNMPITTLDNGNFRTYRLAVVTTVEYSAFHVAAAGLETATYTEKMEAVLSAIAVTITRVNSMYERDLSVSLQLIENNDEIVFIDADELNNDDAGALLNEGNTVMYDVIGADNFDMGHSFGTGGGGLAAGAPCSDFKGGAMTGIGSPVGDPFDIDYVAHEMGHQFGAGHTFNAECGGNRSDDLAFEPGGGTTILAYAGVCDPVIQSNSDAQLHAVSIAQMRSRINGDSNCVPLVNSGNTPPVANAGSDYTIPKGTAFILEGTAVDADGDALTYDWEQMNNEISTQPPVADAVGGPNFRSLPITESPNRFMPKIEDVIAGNLAPQWEVIPTVARAMDFALTVRDNNINGGESHTDYMHIQVSGTAGPFMVTSPNASQSWQAGTNKNVTWNVAGTTTNGVNASYVDIYLSADGGFTYPTLLALKVPNDGSETIIVPNLPGAANRIMVRGHNTIFYDISNANFTITTAEGNAFFENVSGQWTATACKGTDVSYTLSYQEMTAALTPTTTFTATGNPEGSVVAFSPESVNADGPITMAITNTNGADPGLYTIVVTMTSGTTVRTQNIYLDLLSPEFNELALLSPQNMAVGQPSTVTLSWNPDSNATMYELQVATDDAFISVISDTSTTASSYTVSGLQEATNYYWRVHPQNEGCAGNFTGSYKFSTGNGFCTTYASANVPLEISGGDPSTINSGLTVTDNFSVFDANLSLTIEHSWIADVVVKLISPAGTSVLLFGGACGDQDGAEATFDDSGSPLSCGSSPAISGTVIPAETLSAFNGESSLGEWKLEISDTEGGDGGAINSWSLELCGVSAVLGVAKNTTSDFAVYPNPSNGSFVVQFDANAGEPVNIRVYDMSGRSIYDTKINASDGLFTEPIQLTAQSGMYLIEVNQGGRKTSEKILVK
jgi:subtilisin-like proprotein convertase family protein